MNDLLQRLQGGPGTCEILSPPKALRDKTQRLVKGSAEQESPGRRLPRLPGADGDLRRLSDQALCGRIVIGEKYESDERSVNVDRDMPFGALPDRAHRATVNGAQVKPPTGKIRQAA